ncbi:hypothetical protein ACET93_07775 [Aeromonas veronii]
MNNTIVNSLNKASSIISNEKSRQDALNEIDNAIKELTELRRKVAGESHGVNSFSTGAPYHYTYEDLPE